MNDLFSDDNLKIIRQANNLREEMAYRNSGPPSLSRLQDQEDHKCTMCGCFNYMYDKYYYLEGKIVCEKCVKELALEQFLAKVNYTSHIRYMTDKETHNE